MGCTSTLPQECNTCNKYHRPNTLDPDYYDKMNEQILSSRCSLEIPQEFESWFPAKHGHENIRKLFIWHGLITNEVHEVEYKGQICAVKLFQRNDEYGTQQMLFKTEARVLSKLNNPGIITFIDMFLDEKYYYLVLERADYDLHFLMTQNTENTEHTKTGDFSPLSEKKTKYIIYSLLQTLRYIHRKNLVHRDLKPENIVFVASEPYKPRLIDFGDATMAKKDKIYTEDVGTPQYMSPERVNQHNIHNKGCNGLQLKKSDIWSIGIIAFEMFSGQSCFKGNSQNQIFDKILKQQWSWPNHRRPSHEMIDFVQQCLKYNADERLSVFEALKHSWFVHENQLNDDHSNSNSTVPF